MTELSKREQNRLQKAAELAECAHARGDQVIGEYVGNKEKISMRCSNGHEFSITPSNYKNLGQGCRKCAGQCPEQAKEDFHKEADKRGDQVVGEYKNTHAKVEMRCKDNHQFFITPSHYKNGKGCVKCAGMCPEQAKEQLYKEADKRGDQVVGEYTGSNKKISMRCSNGHEFSITPNHYKNGQGCNKCAGQCPEQAKEDFYKTTEERGDQVVGEYVNTSKKVEMKCSQGHSFFITPNSYKTGYGCAKCAGLCPEQAKEQLYKLAEERGDQVVGEYKNTHAKVEMRCSKGHEFSMTPNCYKIKGHGCPVCAKSGYNPDQQGVFYVVRWDHPKFKSFIKFGITGDLTQRLKQQSRKTEFSPEIIMRVAHQDGQNSQELEREIKAVQSKHGGHAITKDDFADGYTETVRDAPEVLADIQATIKSFCFGL